MMSCWARVVPWAVISFSGAGQSVRLSKQGSGVRGFAAPAGLLVCCFGVGCPGVGCSGIGCSGAGCSGIGCFGRKTGCGRFRKFFRRHLRSIIITVRMRV
ncbi:hypothetical protein NXX20_10135 [Bacteroides stercoris]|nr:hypothetical protein [Bacteroides stercoris]